MRLMALVLGVLLLSGGIWLLLARRRAKKSTTTASSARQAEATSQVLAKTSEEVEAWQALVGLLKESLRRNQSEAAYRVTFGAKPDYPNAWLGLGDLLADADHAEEAESAYRWALQANPRLLPAYAKLGRLLQLTGRPDEAEAHYRQALTLDPDAPEILNSLGALLCGRGSLDEAEACFRQALNIHAGFTEAYYRLGMLLEIAGRLDEAVAVLRQATLTAPNFPEGFRYLAQLLAKAGQFSDAEAAYHAAIRLQPGFAEAFAGLAELLAQTGQEQEAEDAWRKVIQLRPDRPEPYSNLGSLLEHRGRAEEAEAAYRETLSLDPGNLMALSCLGALLHHGGRYVEAEASLEKALQIDPFFPFARIYRAYLNLLRGHYGQGFEDHEYRWQSTFQESRPVFPQPLWDGKPFPGQTLLVHWEQGLGDNIQMFRYLRLLAAMGGQVLLETPLPLVRLFEANAPECVTILGDGQALPDFGQHCPVMSLPWLFNTRLDSIPPAAPFLKPPEDAIAACAKIPGTGLKVGVVWAGNPTHKNDRNRSIDFALLEPLFAVPRISWVILQKERRPDDFAALAVERGWWDPMDSVSDFADTAAIIGQLDLVIGVDTSVIHMAAAMGKPTWLLLPYVPDWRWLLGRDDNPWYPTMRLFRQATPGQWPAVIPQLADALLAFENEFRGATP